MVSNFLNVSLAIHLLFNDADIGFESDPLVRMMEADKEVAAGMYLIKAPDLGMQGGGRELGAKTIEEAALTL